MSTLAQHSARLDVTLGTEAFTLPLLDVEVTIDEERVPYIQASATLPLTDVLMNIDPTDRVLWMTLELRRQHGRVDRIRELTRRYRDRILSFITGQFEGEKISAISDTLYHDYDTPGADPSDLTRTFRLTLRSLQIDYAADTITLTLTSGEGPLIDHALMDTNGIRAVGQTLNDKVDWLIGQGTGFTLNHPATGVPTNADIEDEAMWLTGQTVWDCLQNLTRTHGYQVWCDEAGEFHLATARPTPATVTLYGGTGPDRSITNVTEERSRDSGWANAVLVTYEWDDVTTYDVAVTNPQGQHKVHRVDVPRDGNSVLTTPGRAQQTLDTITGRHIALEVLAVSDYTLDTGGQAVVNLEQRQWDGHVAAVRWSLPQDQMSIRLRDVKEL